MVSTPYSTAKPLFGALPSWLDEYEGSRINSYKFYEDLYWGNPDAYKLVQRGTDGNPIYIPSGRVIVNTMNRYTAKGWAPVVQAVAGQEVAEAQAMTTFNSLFKREKMSTKYNSAKRFGLIRGDWCWQITANPAKPQGSRISIKAIDPGMYFPIVDDRDVDRILGVDLIEQITENSKQYIVRQRYLKSDHPDRGGTVGGNITYEKVTLEIADWRDPAKAKRLRIDTPQYEITGVTSLPVYHIKNFEEPQNPYGASEMRGLERIMAGVNQTITDEDLALALAGLGVYSTDAGSPRNAQGEAVPWGIWPGAVIEVGSGKKFDRVQGVSSVTPMQDHLAYLHDQLGRVSGASDVAQGVVDVTVAESGIALGLRMAPILTEAEEKQVGIGESMDQMLYDLKTQWLKVYESLDFSAIEIVSSFAPPLPKDNKARFDELMQMYTAVPPLISAKFFTQELRAMGYAIPEGVALDIIQEQADYNAATDEFGSRLEEEAGVVVDEELI